MTIVMICSRYPYVSHLICNAGVASMSGINWPKAIWQLCTDFLGAVTAPGYFYHTFGKLSTDGLGWVWQCNVFGHYCLVSSVAPMSIVH
jgi:3-keto steroid reductase